MLETAGLPDEGFKVVFTNDNFKAAFITHSEDFAYGRVELMKRHNKTDEIFVLLRGRATMLILEDDRFTETELEADTAYNVTRSTWHYLAVSPDAVVFVCENSDTSVENTDRLTVDYMMSYD